MSDNQNIDPNLEMDYLEIPEIPAVDIDKISQHKKDEIEATFEKAKRTADQKYQETLQPAEDTKAEAESKYNLANKKYDSAIKTLEIQINNGIKDLWQDYQDCQSDSSGKEVSPDKKAICVTEFNQKLSEKKVEFQKGKQKFAQTKAAAEAEWQKAQKDYELAKNLAEIEKENTYKKAEVEKYENISKALQDYFD